LKKLPEDTPVTETISFPVTEQEAVLSPQAVHVVMESEQEEELQPRQKGGRTEPSSIPAEGPSSHHAAWDPALLFGPNPISVRDTILDHSDADASARVAHGLAFAACLPEDMKRWAGTQPGNAFRQITHGLMMVSTSLLTSFLCIYIFFAIFPFLSSHVFHMFYLYLFTQATQGVRSIEAKFYRLTEKFQKNEAEHEKMSEMLKVAGDNYARLEGQHHKNIVVMKEAEERARAEETRRAEAEAEVVRLQEQVKKMESECVSRLSVAHKEGMEEGLIKGEELGLTKGKELGRE
jgi:hypothetical protein